MRPAPDELLHFSEDPTLTVFHPHVAPAVPVGDLLRAHQRAGIQLRLVDRLWPWWDAVITSTVAFSGIRLRNGTECPYGP